MKYNPNKHHYSRSYSGNWKDGEFDGFGTYEYVDGKYVGGFKKGKKNGQGVDICTRSFRAKDDDVTTITIKFIGKYKNGQRSKGQLSTQNPLPIVYLGDFDDKGRFNGLAQVWINGRKESRMYKKGHWVHRKSGAPVQKLDELQCLI